MNYRLGVDIGATRTMFALVDADTPRVLAHDRPNTDLVFTGARAPGQTLVAAIARFLEGQGVARHNLLGVAVGVPGLVRQRDGHVLACPNLRLLDGSDLGPDAEAALGVPVYLDNNTNLIALGEHAAGAGQNVDELAVVFVGSGVGCGLVINGRLYHGADGLAAELGHTVVVPNGLACSCGGRGCAEMYCSGKALSMVAEQIFEPRELFHMGTRFAGASLVIEQARAGHQRARRVLEQSFTYLGIALANLVVLLSPGLIVLGGGIVEAWPEGIEVATRVVRREATIEVPRHIEIVPSALGPLAGVLGGATLVGQMADHSR